MKGLYLQGGGAKGAFQAGVIYGLYERGIKFDVLSGTSIGAINGYFIYTGNIEEMKKLWTSYNFDGSDYKDMLVEDRVIENKSVIDVLDTLEGKDRNIKSFYVNYIKIKNEKINELKVDISKLTRKEGINAVKYSSLLPYRLNEPKTLEEIFKDFDFQKVIEDFYEDLKTGIYDKYNLDGGLVNNNSLSPFLKNKLDSLYIITFTKDYKIPDYILNTYDEKNILVIKPNSEFSPNDTLRFENKFCKDIFQEGYNLSKVLDIKI
ncbi:patatin-like phospholipase family protein [Clostridiisalibacter paucivorans]|uniref:patatin-like phospholipase family protein n=1 Tax=Clostridiisalibacter paucivorans TaxID=408753 RepID=UPI000479CBF3|nr:patatin-like phospholipase family protein [Clostridiisalibacter paucivorans]